MIVVADTSVLLNLCFLGQEPLLARLFGEVHAPMQVEAEFKRLASHDPRFVGVRFPEFVIQSPIEASTHPWARSPALHAGEVAALALALDLRADLVLMDEAAGRSTAAALGLRSMGLLGILIEARRRDWLPALAPLLDRLQNDASFWIAPALRASILRAAGE